MALAVIIECTAAVMSAPATAAVAVALTLRRP